MKTRFPLVADPGNDSLAERALMPPNSSKERCGPDARCGDTMLLTLRLLRSVAPLARTWAACDR